MKNFEVCETHKIKFSAYGPCPECAKLEAEKRELKLIEYLKLSGESKDNRKGNK